MTKILNIDTLTTDARTVVLGGVEHAVVEMNVDNFLATTKAAEELQNTNAPLTAQVESAVSLIMRSIPTVSRETLNKIPLRHLQTIVAFVRGDDVEAAPEATDPVVTGGGKGAKNPRARK